MADYHCLDCDGWVEVYLTVDFGREVASDWDEQVDGDGMEGVQD